MAFDPSPGEVWEGYACDGVDIALPITAFDDLSSSEAESLTGDFPSILFSLAASVQAHYAGLSAGSLPTDFVAYPATERKRNAGDMAGKYLRTYDFRFDVTDTNIYTVEVAEEPV